MFSTSLTWLTVVCVTTWAVAPSCEAMTVSLIVVVMDPPPGSRVELLTGGLASFL